MKQYHPVVLILLAVAFLFVQCDSAEVSTGQDGDYDKDIDGETLVSGDGDYTQIEGDPDNPGDDHHSGDGDWDGGDASGPCASGEICDGSTGLCEANPPCSIENPCDNDGTPVTTAFEEPICVTMEDDRPYYDDAPPRLWTDSVTGEERGACVFRPAAASDPPRPLVVFVHGSGGRAEDVYNATSLRTKAVSYDLSGDPARPGFVLVSVQGRLMSNPNQLNTAPMRRHDVWYRDLSSPSTNADFRNFDKLIDDLVEEGGVDTNRIYLMGWSNGGVFAQSYGISRHTQPTPGGHFVAAVVSYASGDPFEDIGWDQDPSCKMSPYPSTSLPMLVSGRACDSAVACDQAQQEKFDLPPGYDVSSWVNTLTTVMENSNVVHLIVDGYGNQKSECTQLSGCSGIGGLVNHLRWPDGVADKSGIDWEDDFLDFLKEHPKE